MTFISTVLIIFLIIPLVPVFAYVIGLLIPASHIVSRSHTFKISPQRLWNILTNVTDYPKWQPKVERVVLDKSNNEEGTLFVEYSTKKRHTVIIHHERIKNKCLLRILEERPASAIVSTDTDTTTTLPSKIPTFSGSWTFEIIQQKEDDDEQVTLKITEQGVIKKPMVRMVHLLLFGFHSRIDRFINDLHKKIDSDNKEVPLVDFINEQQQQQQQESLFYSTNLQNSSSVVDDDTPINHLLTPTDHQQVDTNDLLSESKISDKEWDLMSEIYERP